MFGLILVLLATTAIVFGSYRLGTGSCEADLATRDAERNTSLTVVALGVMCLMSGVLAAISGTNNPFDAFVQQPQPLM
jgi:hypothetical protein